jgi:SAM-dependent methyltransferase
MITIREQLSRGVLVCPRTRMQLREQGNSLVSDEGTAYTLTPNGVPVLLLDAAEALKYSRESAVMTREYSAEAVKKKSSVPQRVMAFLFRDYRTKASRDAFDKAIASASDDALCLSIGGGPDRPHPKLVNLNIGPFPNVDIVADAHELPYADKSVDAIYCEAVLEHLENPVKAVEEMFRILKPGGKIIAITPFLQAFHGYPNHFQNFTVVGHSRLFSRTGFLVIESGPCVGPMVTVMDLGHVFLCCYLPKFLSIPCRVVWKLMGAILVPMGSFLADTKYGYVMPSTTYVLAEKPTLAPLSPSSR